jgi:membrane associated rhomboid family serine protease
MHVRPSTPSHSTTLPICNYAIILAMTCAFAVQMLLDPGAQYLKGLVLTTWSVPGLFGHMWLHMTAAHLVGNLVTLWIFGYGVCPRIGARTYGIAYVTAGLGAGLVHLMYDGRPVIGASGAIMGILGMYVVLCYSQFGRLGPWLILTWFLATLGAAIIGDLNAAYVAHIGGFLSGMLVAVCLTVCGIGTANETSSVPSPTAGPVTSEGPLSLPGLAPAVSATGQEVAQDH